MIHTIYILYSMIIKLKLWKVDDTCKLSNCCMIKLDCVELQNTFPNSKMSLLVKLLDGPAKPGPFLLGMSTIGLLTSMISSSSFGADVWNKILPGITHWQSPKFFGYYLFNVSTAAGSLGEVLSGGGNFTGFKLDHVPSGD